MDSLWGKRIKEIRLKLGLTQVELSEKIDFTRTFISEIEIGNKQPSFNFLIALKEKLNVSSDYILSGEGEIFNHQEIQNPQKSNKISNKNLTNFAKVKSDVTVLEDKTVTETKKEETKPNIKSSDKTEKVAALRELVAIQENASRQPKEVPIMPVKASAGFGITGNFQVMDYEIENYISIPNVETNWIAFYITGDSMLPTLFNDDIVICKPLNGIYIFNLKPYFDLNKLYIITTESGVYAKRLRWYHDFLVLQSDNPVITDMYVTQDQVKSIFEVKRVISEITTPRQASVVTDIYKRIELLENRLNQIQHPPENDHSK